MNQDNDAPRAPFTNTRRIETLERQIRDHSASLTSVVGKLHEVAVHLDNLIEWKHEKAIEEAVKAERDKSMLDRLSAIEESSKNFHKELKSGMNRILWAIGLIVLGVVVNYALNGGFTLYRPTMEAHRGIDK